MKKSNTILWLIVFVIVVWSAFTLWKNKKEVTAKVYIPDVNQRVFVSVEKVTLRPIETELSFVGTLEATETVLSSLLSGTVKKVFFNDGDFVNKGQRLAQLDNDVFLADYQASKTKQNSDSLEYSRFAKAAEISPGSVSKNQLDQLKAKWEASISMTEKLGKQLEYARMESPYSGYMTQKDIEVGTVVSPGRPFARLVNLSNMKVKIFVSETEVNYFKRNQNMEVDILDERVQGDVIYVSPRADNSHKYEVHVKVNNPDLRFKAGNYATINVGLPAGKKSLSISRSALLGSALHPQVYVVKDGMAQQTYIKIESLGEKNVFVRDGLKEGELVVVSGQISIQNGTKVRFENFDKK